MLDSAEYARQIFPEQVDQMTDVELLEAVWALEATYKQNTHDHARDHRRYLRRVELERIFQLARRRAQLKVDACR